MSHLEDLIVEYYDWKGYVVKRNIKVGRLDHGGWAGELDVIAYNPHTPHLLHLEPSIDANSWQKREKRFIKKFEAGRKYILKDVFTWLDKDTTVEQIAILITHPKGRDSLAGGKIRSIDEFVAEVRGEVEHQGVMAKNAIPEQYPLLRTIQLSHKGYHKAL